MRFEYPKDETRKRILEKANTIAVVGLSSKEDRPSYHVAAALQNAGYKIIPVNPNEVEVLGEKAVSSLSDIQENVDIVDVFRRSDQVMPIVTEAVEKGIQTIWLQQGVYNEEAADYARERGLTIVMDRCIKVDHSRLQVGKK